MSYFKLVINHLSELLHCSPGHTIGQQRQDKNHVSRCSKSVPRSIISKGLWSPGVYLSLSYWIFSACRLKKHAYAGLTPSENHASQGENLRTNTRNSAFPRALRKYEKMFLSETTRPRALIFGFTHHLVDCYQVCSNYAPGAPGVTCFT